MEERKPVSQTGLILLLLVLMAQTIMYWRLLLLAPPPEGSGVITVLGAATIAVMVYVILKKFSVDMAVTRTSAVLVSFLDLVAIPVGVQLVGYLRFESMLGVDLSLPLDPILLFLALVIVCVMADANGAIKSAISQSELFEVRGGGWERILYRKYPPQKLSDIVGFAAVVGIVVVYAAIG